MWIIINNTETIKTTSEKKEIIKCHWMCYKNGNIYYSRKKKKTQRKLLHSTPLVTIINCWYKHINENIRPFSVMTKWFDFLILWVSDWVSEWASVHVNMQIKCVFNFDDRNDFKSVTEIRNLSFCIEFCFLNFIFRLN